jgi:APA family basic amino acid/polyamine antiporter
MAREKMFIPLAALALIVLRKKMPGVERPYKTWGYPVVPLMFFLILGAVVVNVFVSSPAKSFIGSAIILGGLPLYIFFRRKEKKHAA